MAFEGGEVEAVLPLVVALVQHLVQLVGLQADLVPADGLQQHVGALHVDAAAGVEQGDVALLVHDLAGW